MLYCPNCNRTPENDQEKFCPSCGVPFVQKEEPQPEVAPVVEQPAPQPVAVPVMEQPTPVPQPIYVPAPAPVAQNPEDMLPEEYRPLGPWAYFGLNLLFSVPIVGFIFLIIFSFKRSNINRRNYARSFWCAWLILGGIALIVLLFVAVLGFMPSIASGY